MHDARIEQNATCYLSSTKICEKQYKIHNSQLTALRVRKKNYIVVLSFKLILVLFRKVFTKKKQSNSL